jgi:hypothetical protein
MDTNLIIYKVTGWSNPLDWASTSKPAGLGYFMTRKGAEAKVELMKDHKDWRYHWSDFEIQEVEVLP